jgi:hypothetical protein
MCPKFEDDNLSEKFRKIDPRVHPPAISDSQSRSGSNWSGFWDSDRDVIGVVAMRRHKSTLDNVWRHRSCLCAKSMSTLDTVWCHVAHRDEDKVDPRTRVTSRDATANVNSGFWWTSRQCAAKFVPRASQWCFTMWRQVWPFLDVTTVTRSSPTLWSVVRDVAYVRLSMYIRTSQDS